MVMTPTDAIAFVRLHGIVLESARGPVPNLAEAVAGGRIRRSWWGHPKAQAIFAVTRAVRDSPDVLVCRLLGGKVTYIHRRLWPAVVRLADKLGTGRLTAIGEEHTASGAHQVGGTAFPQWVPPEVKAIAERLSEGETLSQLGEQVVRALGAGATGSSPARKRR
jgi:hypothetical protein